MKNRPLICGSLIGLDRDFHCGRVDQIPYTPIRPAWPDVVVTFSASSAGPVGSTHVEVLTRWKARFVEDLKAKFLDQVREGVFTPGEDVHSD